MLSICSRPFFVAALGLMLAFNLGGPARAGYVVKVIESGGDVVATGSGTLNLTDLNGNQYSSGDRFITPDAAELLLGAPGSGQGGLFEGISGPSTFGPGTGLAATSGTGDIVGLEIDPGPGLELAVPQGYVSGSQLIENQGDRRSRPFRQRGAGVRDR